LINLIHDTEISILNYYSIISNNNKKIGSFRVAVHVWEDEQYFMFLERRLLCKEGCLSSATVILSGFVI
jgi:hypothetical protein